MYVDKQGKNTDITLINAYCFCTATVVMRTHCSVTWKSHYLSCVSSCLIPVIDTSSLGFVLKYHLNYFGLRDFRIPPRSKWQLRSSGLFLTPEEGAEGLFRNVGKKLPLFLISNFRRVVNVICFLLCNSPGSKFLYADVSEHFVPS